MATVNYKCPQCGGPLKFNPDKQLFSCEYCLGEFSDETIQQMYADKEAKESQAEKQEKKAEEKAKENPNSDEEEAVVYNCPSCGAEVVTTKSTAATTCFYCQNPVVLGGRLSGEFKPDRVIPFALSKEKAIEKFIEVCGKKWFLPKGFIDKKHFENLNGVYFPYWYIDEQKTAEVVGKGEKIRTWSIGNKTYTETSHYRLERAGDVILKNVFERALKSEDRDMLQSVHPYDLKEAHKFSMSYLSGFQAEKRDIEIEEVHDIVEKRMQEYSKQLFKDTMRDFSSVRIDEYSDKNDLESWNYTLLPVWVATYKHGGKIYPFAINGQTGKTYGKLPIAWGKLLAFAGVIAVVIFVLGILGGMLL